MLARDRKVSLRIVIEAEFELPAQIRVAGFAGLEGTVQSVGALLAVAVIVRVTAAAILRKPSPAIEAAALAEKPCLLLMTVDALHLSMLAAEVKRGHTVVEVFDFPAFLSVAAGAGSAAELRTEVIAVLVLMAAKALLGLQLWPLILDVVLPLDHVALFTALFGVRTDQLVARFFLMIEGDGILPAFGVVAAAALFAFELVLKEVDVVFGVTLDTGVDRSEVASLIRADRLPLPRICMTFRTFNLAMGPIKLKARFRMVEGFAVEIEWVEGAPLVV